MVHVTLITVVTVTCYRVDVGRRAYSNGSKKLQVFIDDKPVLVAPGTTILQVCTSMRGRGCIP